MLKPEYIFLWILFHLSAVELPKSISKRGKPSLAATEFVQKYQYKSAIETYGELADIKSATEMRSLAMAFAEMGYNDTAYKVFQALNKKYPDSFAAIDQLQSFFIARRLGKYSVSDSLAGVVKAGDFSASAVINQAQPDFLENSNRLNERMGLPELKKFESTLDQYLPVFDSKNGTYYYHERKPIYSGLLNSNSELDGMAFGKILKANDWFDSISIKGTVEPNQVLNRHFELSYIDTFGNKYITTGHKLVNDQDKYLLDVFRYFYSKKAGKYVLQPVGFDKWLYNVSSLSMNESQTKAIFCSDMEGTIGKSDIFTADVSWDADGKPTFSNYTALGETANSILSESDPIFINDDIVAFATEGHAGYGGTDIYFYSIEKTKLLNAGIMVNSTGNEYSPKIINDRFYFSSNKLNNRYRIYSTNLPVSLIESILYETPEVLDTTVQIEEPVLVAQVVKNQTMQEMMDNLSVSEPMKYDYAKRLSFVLLPDSVRKQMIDSVNDQSDYGFFQFVTLLHPQADMLIEKEFESELNLVGALLSKRKDWAVEIRSHTDSRGSTISNKRLSQNRADFVVSYLKNLGVNENQLFSVGMGESYLINHCLDDAPCTDAEHRRNRRTELIIKPIIKK